MPTAHRIQPATYTFGEFTVRTGTRQVLMAEVALPMPPKLFDLLTVLITHRPNVVSRKELMRWVWPETAVSKGALPQAVMKLRTLLGGEGSSEQWIATVRGVGYRFVGDVTVGQSSSSGVSPSPAPLQMRGSAQLEQVQHRVETLHRRAWEQTLRLDLAGIRETVDLLRRREECGSDPRAKIYALLHENILDRHGNEMEKAWHGLELAEQLANEIPDLEMKVMLLRAKGRFFLHFDALGDAIAVLREAFELAKQLANRLEVADCANLLAAGFARVGDAESFAEWSETAIKLAKQSHLDWYVLHGLVSMASFWIGLGESARSSGDVTAARRCWLRADQLLDEAESAPGWTSHTKVFSLATLNRALVRGSLFPEERKASLSLFRDALEVERVPQLRLGILLALAIFSRDEGDLEAAKLCCERALDIIQVSKVFNVKTRFLDLAADVATRQGRHLDAVRNLRDLLAWCEQSTRAESMQIAKVTALRLKTERALAAAEAERELTRRYQLENEVLQQRLRLQDIETRLDMDSGFVSPSVFRKWLSQAFARSKQEQLPLPLATFTALPSALVGERFGVSRSKDASEAQIADECLGARLRVGDRWSRLSDQMLVVAFATKDLDRAYLAAHRLHKALQAAFIGHGVMGVAVSLSVSDAVEFKDSEMLWSSLSEPSDGTRLTNPA